MVPYSLGSNQAAVDSMLVARLVKGEISVVEWQEHVLAWADQLRLQSVAFGSWYLCTWYGIAASQVRLQLELCRQKLSRWWYGTAYPTPL